MKTCIILILAVIMEPSIEGPVSHPTSVPVWSSLNKPAVYGSCEAARGPLISIYSMLNPGTKVIGSTCVRVKGECDIKRQGE